ncbi:MAG: hypothetical protein EA359_02545 [Balneolaceae bacterium]|nr:MAG: hypothetical protein EA359_02545 [Balneolaceae bacterium]
MRKGNRRYVVFPFLLLFVFGLAAFAVVSEDMRDDKNGNTYYVAINGSDEAEGTMDDPWASVERALSETGPGDAVLLRGGVYKINRAVQLGEAQGTENGWITVRSYPGERAVFDAEDFKKTDEGLTPHQAGLGTIDISGAQYLRVKNIDVRNSFGEGFRISRGSRFIELIGCSSDRSFKSGIAAWGIGHGGAENIRILHSEVTGANDLNMALPADGGPGARGEAPHEGISIAGVHHFEVAYNRVHRSHKEGIDIKERSAHGVVHNNETHDLPRQGIYLDAWFGMLEDVEVHSNRSYNNEWGITLSAEDDGAEMRNIRVHSNFVYNNRASGIMFGLFGHDEPRSDIKIYNNTVVDNGSLSHWHGSTGGIDLRSANVRDVYVVNNLVVNNTGFEIASFAADDERDRAFSERNIVVRNNMTSPFHNSVEEMHEGWGQAFPFRGEDTIESENIQFVFPNAADFRLRPGSDAINAAIEIDGGMLAHPHIGAGTVMPVYND